MNNKTTIGYSIKVRYTFTCKEAGMDIPNKEKERRNKTSHSKGVFESVPSHVAIKSENVSSITETQQLEEPGKNSGHARKGQTPTRTWTKIARPAQESEE